MTEEDRGKGAMPKGERREESMKRLPPARLPYVKINSFGS